MSCCPVIAMSCGVGLRTAARTALCWAVLAVGGIAAGPDVQVRVDGTADLSAFPFLANVTAAPALVFVLPRRAILLPKGERVCTAATITVRAGSAPRCHDRSRERRWQ